MTETCYFSSINFPGRGKEKEEDGEPPNAAAAAYEIRTQFFISGEIRNLGEERRNFTFTFVRRLSRLRLFFTQHTNRQARRARFMAQHST